MKYFLFVLVLLFSPPVFAQRIVKNILIPYIMDEFDTTDSLLISNGYSERLIYKSMSDSSKVGESLVRYEEYNKTGQLKRLTLGRDILHGKINLLLICNKLSDTTWSVVAKYPPGSEELTSISFSLDTIIDGKRIIIPLYKKDAEGNIVIRSVIGKRDEDGFASYAKTYDLNDSLIETYYPLYRGDQKKEWYDTVAGPYGRTENYHMVDDKVIFRSTEIYNKRNRRLQSSYVTQNLGSVDYDEGYTMYGYDTAGKQICRVSQGENGSIGIERWYSKDGKLTRYTKDYDLIDDSLNEDRRYDRYGNLIFLEHVSSDMWPVYRYSFRWDVSVQGLYQRKEEYYSGKLRSIYRYKYR